MYNTLVDYKNMASKVVFKLLFLISNEINM